MAKRQLTAEQVEKFARKQKVKAGDYRRVFDTEQGKRVLYDLFNEHHMMRSTYSKDPLEIAFREGERNVVLKILAMMKADPEEIERKIKEAHSYATS